MWREYLHKNIKIREIILIIIIIAVSLFYIYYGLKNDDKYDNKVVLYNKGDKKVYSLDKNQVIDIGTHKIIIKNSRVRIRDAVCPLKICEKQGWVKDGVIVCVPEKVAVEIYNTDKKKEFDVIVK